MSGACAAAGGRLERRFKGRRRSPAAQSVTSDRRTLTYPCRVAAELLCSGIAIKDVLTFVSLIGSKNSSPTMSVTSLPIMEGFIVDDIVSVLQANHTDDQELQHEVTFCNATDLLQFNFSEYDYPGGDGPWPPPLDFVSAIKIAICIVNMIMSILGNCAVVVAVYHNPALRSTINYYLVNLAVADVLIALCCMWPHLVNDLTKPAFVLGAFMCKFNAFAQMSCLTSSVLTLTAIACDRFMAVLFPLRVRITQCRAGAVIISIWAISIVVSIPFAIYRRLFEIQWKNAVEVTCQETWPAFISQQQSSCVTSVWPKTAYYTLVSVTLFFLPVVIMSIAYAMIVGRLWGSQPPGEKLDSALSNQGKAKKKVVKMVVVILLVFVICWVPLQVLILYAQFSHDQKETGELPQWYDHVMFSVYFIAYSNSTVNPLLYGGLNQTYRKTLLRVLCRKWRSSRPESLASMQGSLQMAELRASPKVNHSRVSSTHTTRSGILRHCHRQHANQPMSTTLGNASLRSHRAPQYPHTALYVEVGPAERETRFSYKNRSFRQRQDLLG